MDVTVDIPVNARIDTNANIPVVNDPLPFWSDVANNFVAESNITATLVHV
jgi:hypothetical protein